MNRATLVLGLTVGISEITIGILFLIYGITANSVFAFAGVFVDPSLVTMSLIVIVRGLIFLIAGIFAIVGGAFSKGAGGILMLVASMMSLFGGQVWVVALYGLLFLGAMIAFNEPAEKVKMIN